MIWVLFYFVSASIIIIITWRKVIRFKQERWARCHAFKFLWAGCTAQKIGRLQLQSPLCERMNSTWASCYAYACKGRSAASFCFWWNPVQLLEQAKHLVDEPWRVSGASSWHLDQNATLACMIRWLASIDTYIGWCFNFFFSKKRQTRTVAKYWLLYAPTNST